MAGIEQAPTAGTVRVANEVIASIAAMAAREVDGVVGMDDASARHLGSQKNQRPSSHLCLFIIRIIYTGTFLP